MDAKASIATSETDEALKKQCAREGALHCRRGGLPVVSPYDMGSLMYKWWLDGYVREEQRMKMNGWMA